MEEVYALKVRIKYTKTEHFKFIGHLDLMRYFQKAVKRAGLDIAYSQGFSPHQLMSFAAPLALGVTSEGEYFDAEFNSLVSSDEFVKRLNEQMTEGVMVKDVILLPDRAKNSMSLVAASDYYITLVDRGEESLPETDWKKVLSGTGQLLAQEHIEILRKTKNNEKIEDIRKGIYKLYPEADKLYPEADKLYMLLATGSEYNLKPELVVEALCREQEVTYNRLDYQVHRIETYMKNDEGKLVSLLESGTRIE